MLLPRVAPERRPPGSTAWRIQPDLLGQVVLLRDWAGRAGALVSWWGARERESTKHLSREPP